MKITELLGGRLETIKDDVYHILDDFTIWTTLEERELLTKLKHPVKLAALSEHDQFRVQTLIRKSLVTKIGVENPTVVANEKNK